MDLFNEIFQTLLFGVTAGIFLDVFSYMYFGPSIIMLVIIGFLLKKIQRALKSGDDNYPFSYFFFLFIIFFILYNVELVLYARFIDSSHIITSVNLTLAVDLVYSLLFAGIGFFVFKKYVKKI